VKFVKRLCICRLDLIISDTKNSKIILVSHALGKIAHNHNKAWEDPSGKKLREWLGVAEEQFYNPYNFAVLPMGFCYPVKARTGDLPPIKEYAPISLRTI
jgi:uracil-DNA glycosylase